MKIAFAVHDYHRSGGHSRYVAELAERYAAEHEVHVFANTFREDPDSRIQFHHVPAWRGNALTLILSFRRNATKLLRSGGFDIIHDQGLCCARKHVVTAHICNAAWNANRKLASFGEQVFGIIAARMEQWQYSRCGPTRVIAVSGRVRDDLAHWYGFRGDATVVHHGVDSRTFSPANRSLWREPTRAAIGVPHDEPLFLFVGDLRKGVELCIRALERGWLVCVSRTPPAEYQALAETLDRAARVVFHPATSQIERYYAAADVFLLPTPYDAFGMVVLEAMAAGVPVIVGHEAGASELIEHGTNGWKLQSPDELPGLMELALSRPEVGEAARITASERTWDRVAAETMRVYHAARRTPRVLAFATQGAGGNDEARMHLLLSKIGAEFFAFDHGRKMRSALALLHALMRGKFDLAFMEGTGVAGGLALLLGRCGGTRYVVSSGDAVAPFVANHHPLLAWLFGIYERLLCRMAAGFIGWSPYLTGRALTFGVPRAATAPGWAPARPVRAGAPRREDTRDRLGIAREAIVIGIVGSLSWNSHVRFCYGLELVRAMEFCRRQDVVALIVGGGTGLGELRRKADARVIFTGAVPRDDVPDYLDAMDMASLPQSCDGVGSFRYTTKLSEYIAAGLPVVTGQLPLAYDLVDGWMWRLPGNSPWDERYVRALSALMERATSAEITAKRLAVPVGSPVFDRDRQVARVTAMLHDILESL